MGETAFTVGYSGRSVEQFLEALRAAGVSRVIDVRELPLSRRRGFSKSALRAALEQNGIEYLHIRRAGNPFRHRATNVDECLSLYSEHLRQHPDIVDEVESALAGRRAALLCVEATAEGCHRSILAKRVTAKRRRKFQHL
jgi:uncharacterized protein (DUF488 family)